MKKKIGKMIKAEEDHNNQHMFQLLQVLVKKQLELQKKAEFLEERTRKAVAEGRGGDEPQTLLLILSLEKQWGKFLFQVPILKIIEGGGIYNISHTLDLDLGRIILEPQIPLKILRG